MPHRQTVTSNNGKVLLSSHQQHYSQKKARTPTARGLIPLAKRCEKDPTRTSSGSGPALGASPTSLPKGEDLCAALGVHDRQQTLQQALRSSPESPSLHRTFRGPSRCDELRSKEALQRQPSSLPHSKGHPHVHEPELGRGPQTPQSALHRLFQSGQPSGKPGRSRLT